MRSLNIPLDDDTIRSLKVGDPILLSGVMVTGRDAAHKWMIDTFIKKTRQPQGDDLEVYEAIKPLLKGGVIYHCGPVVAGLDTKQYRFVAAGPTTSIREEPYQGMVMQHFSIKAVIGKGGMGPKTLAACQEVPGVYLHAIGGAASLIAQTVTRVVTMDARGGSLHASVAEHSRAVLQELLAKA
jgi:fumarate hydratase subunit beta